MKCVRCGHDSKYKERSDGCCPKCRGAFAFEPQKGDKFTDTAFQRAIDAVSAKGQVRWGAEHLYYELARRKRGGVGCVLAVLVIAAIAALLLLAKLMIVPALIAAAVAAGSVMVFRRRRHAKFGLLDQRDFDRMLTAWTKVHGTPKTMIVRAHVRGTPAPSRALEADIGDYSFDRAVICDRARTADVLLANNFHFENNCAVLSADGYPEAHFETIRTMLKRNPRLRVFALHDCTPNGCRLAHKLARDASWFAGLPQVTDAGLRPAQARVFAGLYKPHQGLPVREGDGISAAESRWLSEQWLELAAIRPEQVLKRLYKAMHRDDSDSGSSGGGDDGSSSGTGRDCQVVHDQESFTHDAGDIASDADGFG